MLAVVSYAIYVDVRFASHAVLPLIEGSGGIAVFRQGLLHNFQFLNLNNEKLSWNNWPIEAFSYASSAAHDGIWACENTSRKCGHNLVFTSFFIKMFKFIYIFPYCYGPPIEFVQDIATTSFWSLITVSSILIFAAFVTFTFPTSTLLVP